MSLDDPSRVNEIRGRIHEKGFLRKFYEEVYSKYQDVANRCPEGGLLIELGSGAGFVKEVIPKVITSDTIPYEGNDRVIDAMNMPFKEGELSGIFLMNVFHHIPDVGAFLREASRCLRPGGRIFIFDQHVGWISSFVLKYLHHEPFNPSSEKWDFDSTGPLSDANGALAWIVFQRDRQKFERDFAGLKLERYTPHSPLRYWISGGLKNWSLLPGGAFGAASAVDQALVKVSANFGSFVDIELVKR